MSKSLADRANQYFYEEHVQEEFLTAPQPNTTFDPFTPNYGDNQKSVKSNVADEKKPMETDVEKAVDKPEETNREESDEKGNKSLVRKMYKEMSMLAKDIVVKAKSIDDKMDNINQSIETASDKTINDLDGVSNQVYEDIQRFNDVIKSVVDILNSVEISGDGPEELPDEVEDEKEETKEDETEE